MLDFLVNYISATINIPSVLTYVVGLILGVVVVSLWFSRRTTRISPPPETVRLEKLEDIARIKEIKKLLKRQVSVERWSGRANSLLQFGQIIIGGILTSTFLHEALSPTTSGTLGLLVLASTLMHSHYRPDLKMRGARRRVFALKRLLRFIELTIALMRVERCPDAKDVKQFGYSVCKALAAIEFPDVSEEPGEPGPVDPTHFPFDSDLEQSGMNLPVSPTDVADARLAG